MSPLQPILLLGPGRGGTTLLYKILSLHRDAAFVSNFDAQSTARLFVRPALWASKVHSRIRRWAWFSGEGQAYLLNRALLKRFVPVPVEGESLYSSCGVTLNEYVHSVDVATRNALRTTFGAVQKRHRGKVLLLKRTANNRRIPMLCSAFPECKTIVLWRDGRAVTASLINVPWWLDHPVWWADGKTPRQMNLDRQQSIEIAVRNWVEEVEAIERGLSRVDSMPIMQVRFEDMLVRPKETISSILEFIGLDIPDGFLRQLQSLDLHPSTQGWRTSMSPAEITAVERIGRAQLQRLSYC